MPAQQSNTPAPWEAAAEAQEDWRRDADTARLCVDYLRQRARGRGGDGGGGGAPAAFFLYCNLDYPHGAL